MDNNEFELMMAKRRRMSESETFEYGREPLAAFKNPADVPMADYN